MTPFTVYDATGRILRSGTCQDEALEHQARDGEFVLDIESRDELHYVDTETRELVEIPPSPGDVYVFNFERKVWIDPRTLADLQDLRWAEVKKWRDNVEFGQFTYNGMVFDGDLNAQRRLSTYISVSKSAVAAGSPFEATFTLANNDEVTLTAADFIAIELAKANQVATAFEKARGARNAIYAAQSAAELDSVSWT